jgi:acyl-CoA synthetase (AMP-forming)/AMP-acid ligase II
MAFASKHPPLEAVAAGWRGEPAAASLPELVLAAARRAPEDTALVDGPSGSVVTYATLAGRTERVAATLAARGFAPGDVLGLSAPNSPPWAGVSLGAMRAGGAVTGIHPAATPDEARAQLLDANASLLVGTAPGAVPVAELIEEEGAPPEVQLAPDSLALLPYSSGTTGRSKGVMLTHRNLAAGSLQVGFMLGLERRDTVLAVAPFAHVMGYIVSLCAPLAAGATVVTMPRFELAAALSLVERHRVTLLIVPPPVMAALAGAPAVDEHDLSSVELVVSGGAPLSAELQRAVAARLPHAAVGQGYGLTETAVGVSAARRGAGSVPGSVGTLLPSTELRVVDPVTGGDLGAGVDGELLVRGPQVMAGYLNAPDATAEMLSPDGWLRTGDLGRVDADGNVFVLDRLKELIKVNAFQVAPAELEALLLTRPEVADAAVIPRPDERTGEAPVAVVVARGELDKEALMAWVAERVAPHKRVRDVRVVDEIPRTPAGKLLRRRLVEDDRARTATPA